MMNYLKSENYRLLRKKSFYFTTAICFILITAAAFILYYSGKADSNFPYATRSFFYSNVIGMGTQIIIVAYLYNATLTGKDLSLTKQAVSFGISRSTIFWSKLILTFSYFLLVCIAGLLLMIGLGESLFTHQQGVTSKFLIASFNMVPMVLSGFLLTHSFKMLKVPDIYNVILLIFIYFFSGDLLRLLFRQISGLDEFYKFAPSTQLTDNLMSFMDQSVQVDYRYWITGAVIGVIVLFIGAAKFTKQDID
ncbi:ABC transporter permease [Oceanobacillus sp. J11TS1]|uniref:ABC transporter permease n=1 Tax=Oceanobacillus sp. J11TS1 TaxID=2807191 RepID=UPI001B1ECFD9|nr:ABC transporter permease [Oceanobacillus sp. J11TS1]GIO21439.1 hypothetical protein J11TS1_00200 [Oceanobacillus sp. J11TS1]